MLDASLFVSVYPRSPASSGRRVPARRRTPRTRSSSPSAVAGVLVLVSVAVAAGTRTLSTPPRGDPGRPGDREDVRRFGPPPPRPRPLSAFYSCADPARRLHTRANRSHPGGCHGASPRPAAVRTAEVLKPVCHSVHTNQRVPGRKTREARVGHCLSPGIEEQKGFRGQKFSQVVLVMRMATRVFAFVRPRRVSGRHGACHVSRTAY